MSARNVAASVRAKLLNHARAAKQDFNLVLTRYAIERLLYRMSISRHADSFLLKGALLFDLWFDVPHRPTRDADFLGYGESDLPQVKMVFAEICSIEFDDGVSFQLDTLHVDEIRKSANYVGARVTILALIDGARSELQIDVGFGDAVTPGPEDASYPVLLAEFPAPKLRVYPRYTVVAEKFEALATLGIGNSRMKDYFDLWILLQQADFDGTTLCLAIRATFDRRKTQMENAPPFGLTAAFARDGMKQTQWKAFLRKNKLDAPPLENVVETLSSFLMPVFIAASSDSAFPHFWAARGPWSPMPAT
jgi:hypothetical protein